MSLTRLRGAAGVLMLTAALAPASAHAAGGAEQSATPVDPTMLGSMSWGFYDDSLTRAPNEAGQVRDGMNQAINDYNTVADYSNYVPVSYQPGVPTAQANYNGSIQFGGLRNGRTAHHELSHFMGMQPWVNGGKASWGDLCSSGWANTSALKRMRLYYNNPTTGIGCSMDNGHFWDYGLNQDGEWNWLSKGRNVGMVGAMRGDLGLSDGSTPAPRDARVFSRSTNQMASDGYVTNGGAAVGARSTVSTQQTWTLEFGDGFVRFKGKASGRYLTASGAAATLVGGTPGNAQTWEMAPTTDGYFQLRNLATDTCLRAPGADAALTVSGCDGNPDAPAAALQWHLAKVPATQTAPGTGATPTPTPTATPVPTATPKRPRRPRRSQRPPPPDPSPDREDGVARRRRLGPVPGGRWRQRCARAALELPRQRQPAVDVHGGPRAAQRLRQVPRRLRLRSHERHRGRRLGLHRWRQPEVDDQRQRHDLGRAVEALRRRPVVRYRERHEAPTLELLRPLEPALQLALAT